MPRKNKRSAEFRRRSRAAKKGARTRARNERDYPILKENRKTLRSLGRNVTKLEKKAEFKRRSKAAKLGWKRRRARRTWYVTLAYLSSGNGYTLEFEVTPRKRLGERAVIQLTIKLMRAGHFDDAEANDSRDLRWAASFLNSERAVSGPRIHKAGTAYLIEMSRE